MKAVLFDLEGGEGRVDGLAPQVRFQAGSEQ